MLDEQTRLGKVQMLFGGWTDRCTGFVSQSPTENASGWSIENTRVVTPHVTTLPFGLQQLSSSSNGKSSVLKTSINKQAKNKLSSLELPIHFAIVDVSTDTESPREILACVTSRTLVSHELPAVLDYLQS